MSSLLPLLVLALAPTDAASAPPTRGPDLGLAALDVPSAAIVSPYSIQEEEEEEPVYGWEISASAGASLTTGGADTVAANANLDAVDRQEKDRKTLRGWWNFQEDKGGQRSVISQRRLGGSAQYDRFINDKTYWLLTALIEKDLAAGVDGRWTAGAGLGRQFTDTDTYKFSGEAGISYYKARLAGASDQNYWAARLAYRSHWTPNDRYEIIHLGEILPSLESSDKYAKLDTTAKVTLSDNLYASLQWILDWNNEPPPGAREANNRFFLNIGWSM